MVHNLESQLSKTTCLWTVGGVPGENPRIHIENNANCTLKGAGWLTGSNQDPAWCVALVMINTFFKH